MDKVNFTAKMDISSIKNNTNRWVNIAKTFEKHTGEYPFDTFKVSETPNGIDILNINSKTKQDALVNFEKENLKELLSITDIAIVQRFKNLLSLFEKRDKCYEKTQKYLANERLKQTSSPIFEDKVWDSAVNKIQKEKNKITKSDEILKNTKIYL